MKKILIRSGTTPFEQVPYRQMMEENILGSNIGNLVYASSIYRTMMTGDDVTFLPTKYRYRYTEEEIRQINETCACFVLPLADAVREDFRKELRGLTALVQKLTIPCYVIGMGVRAPYEPGKELSYSFDAEVRAFVAAVLEKSALVGVRGGITADYLTHLGFQAERDFTVIGCPSMYLLGETGIAIREPVLHRDARVFYNLNTMTPEETCAFVRESAAQFTNPVFVPQHVRELRLMYAGAPYRSPELAESFPQAVTDDIYVRGNCRFYGSVASWMADLRTADFCFGTRLHGNVVATLAGTPSLLIPFDARARELAEYHQLTNVPYQEIEAGSSLFSLLDRVDFHSPERVQRQNFAHYVDFLNRNGIDHIYREGRQNQPAPFDLKLKQTPKIPPLGSITRQPPAEIALQLHTYHTHQEESWQKRLEKARAKAAKLESRVEKLEQQQHTLEQQNQHLSRQLETKEEQLKKQEKLLNCRSVRWALRLRTLVMKLRRALRRKR